MASPGDPGVDRQSPIELRAAVGVVEDEHVIWVSGVLVRLEPVARCLARTAEREVVDDHDLLVIAQVLEDVVPR
jgi:hypothetical protein